MMEEKNVKNEKKVEDKGKENEEKGSLRKAVSKFAPLSLKGAVVTLATSAMLVAGCMSDDKKTSNDTNTAEATEVVDESDAESDVPEEVLDVGEDTEDDVDDRDGPVRLDSFEEDVRRDTAWDTDAIVDVPVDVGADEESDAAADATGDETTSVCDAMDASGLLILLTGNSGTIGNVSVKYNGLNTSGEGSYELLCGDSVVRTSISIAEGSTETVNVSEHGFEVTLRVDSARAHATTVYVTVDAA